MATRLQLRKGTTTEHSTFVGANGEVTVDTTKKALVLHDGVTAGGKPLPTLESGKIPLDQLPDTTHTTKGVIELATSPEAVSGTNTTKAITPSTMAIGIKNALNAWSDAPMYACRAWVNFNGTGTPSIRASGNVSSITDNGVGDYTINFTSSMPNTNYSLSGLPTETSDTTPVVPTLKMSAGVPVTKTTSACRISSRSSTTTGVLDIQEIFVQVFC